MRSAVVLLALSCSSCFAVTNLDRFKQSQAVDSNFSDLRLTVRGMTNHVAEYFEYRVIDATGTIQSRGIALPLGGVDETFNAAGAVPKLNGPFHLDFWADHDHNGAYTPPLPDGTFPDHSWHIDLQPPDDNGLIDVEFDHNTSFASLIDPAPKEFGKPATIHLVNLAPLMNKRVEIRVSDSATKRTVALYRLPQVGAATFDAVVPGMIEDEVDYSIEVYTDDGTGANIASYRLTKTSDTSGLDVTFDPATAPPVTDAPTP